MKKSRCIISYLYGIFYNYKITGVVFIEETESFSSINKEK